MCGLEEEKTSASNSSRNVAVSGELLVLLFFKCSRVTKFSPSINSNGYCFVLENRILVQQVCHPFSPINRLKLLSGNIGLNFTMCECSLAISFLCIKIINSNIKKFSYNKYPLQKSHCLMQANNNTWFILCL